MDFVALYVEVMQAKFLASRFNGVGGDRWQTYAGRQADPYVKFLYHLLRFRRDNGKKWSFQTFEWIEVHDEVLLNDDLDL